MKYQLVLCLPLLLAAACSSPDKPTRPATAPAAQAVAAPEASTPAIVTPDPARCHAFLRQTIRLGFLDHPHVRSDGGHFFYRSPYYLYPDLADRLAPPDSVPDGRFASLFSETPPAVLREFRRQVLRLDTAAQRRFEWQSVQLGYFVLVGSTADRLSPELAREVPLTTPVQQQQLRTAIAAWNKEPRQERLVSYASIPLFSSDGRYVLIVRGQSQQSIGWDSLFIYERTASGWKILDAASVSVI
jgi:hypothetical protein